MVGSKFFIFGGQKDDGGFMNDLVWFDLQKRKLESRRRSSAGLQIDNMRTVKSGSPKWSFVKYSPAALVPPRRTGHTTVTHGDCIYV